MVLMTDFISTISSGDPKTSTTRIKDSCKVLLVGLTDSKVAVVLAVVMIVQRHLNTQNFTMQKKLRFWSFEDDLHLNFLQRLRLVCRSELG